MKVILDTNVIFRDYTLDSGWVLKLSDAAKKLGYEVYVPQVVVDEIFHHYRDELLKAYDKYSKAISLLSDLGLKPIKNNIEEDYVENTYAEKEKLYVKRLKELGIKILPYPKTDHKQIVDKELNSRKPFSSSKKGYRDSLIWETVKEQLIPVKDLWGETQVLFLSDNTQDFAGKDKSLHPELVEEFTKDGFTDNAVELISDFDRFIDNRINTELEELDRIAKTLFEKKKFNRIYLKEELQSLLYDEYVVKETLMKDMEKEGVRIPSECENPTIQDINLSKIKSVKVHKLADGSAIIDSEIEAVADIEFYLYRGDAPLFDEDNMPEIIDWEWDDYYYLAAIRANLTAHASLRVSEGFYRVISKEVRTRSVSL